MPDLERVKLEIEAKKKSGWIAALLNIFLPGVGYMYCGRIILGILVMLVAIGLLVAALGGAILGLPIFLFYWSLVFMAVIDGFLCAGRYNKKLITRGLAQYDADKSITQNKDESVKKNFDDLAKLAELKEKGIITEDEFQSQKKRILSYSE
ncbi:MAG: SHOCT domain-containing protein [Phycisphaerae bacterium]|nr:SHOCT domain-containing protein [Phycisphaerae bacterium]